MCKYRDALCMTRAIKVFVGVRANRICCNLNMNFTHKAYRENEIYLCLQKHKNTLQLVQHP